MRSRLSVQRCPDGRLDRQSSHGAVGFDGSNSATKVLASTGSGFNVSAVEALIERGDAAVAAGNLAQAKKDYDNARTASKQLLAFYRDLSGAFRGLDARIPREMDTKGREALALLHRPTSVLQHSSAVKANLKSLSQCWLRLFV